MGLTAPQLELRTKPLLSRRAAPNCQPLVQPCDIAPDSPYVLYYAVDEHGRFWNQLYGCRSFRRWPRVVALADRAQISVQGEDTYLFLFSTSIAIAAWNSTCLHTSLFRPSPENGHLHEPGSTFMPGIRLFSPTIGRLISTSGRSDSVSTWTTFIDLRICADPGRLDLQP